MPYREECTVRPVANENRGGRKWLHLPIGVTWVN